MSKQILFTLTVCVEDTGQDPHNEAAGILNWIDDCEGVTDSELVSFERFDDHD